MRQGENALRVIERVKARLGQVAASLPPGVKVVTAYDRSELILASIDNLKETLLEELCVVALVILIFLWHAPSAVIPIVTIPVAILIAFLPMRAAGMSANIMSLGGIAIAIGAMVDAAIVVVEQTHKKLETAQPDWTNAHYQRAIVDAVKEVGGPSFFALLVIAAGFLPVLTLEAQEGRLFHPLAWTKNFAMIVAAVLAITLDPALRLLLFRKDRFRMRPRWLAAVVNAVLVGTIHSEEKHPISRVLIRLYTPVVGWCLRWKWLVIAGALGLMAVTVPVYLRLGSEFMPPLDEGGLLFMPTTLPGISVAQAQHLLQVQDRILMRFPEVESVMGKAGRAETSTDPAPFSMAETTIVLKPKSQWRKVPTWYGNWPAWLQPLAAHITSDHISTDRLVEEMNQALRLPGVSNAWTMPIKNRIDMQTTGVRTPVGVKIYGASLDRIEQIGQELERVLGAVPGTRSVFAERTGSGYFLDFDLKRERLARYGLSVDDAEMVVTGAIGGENVTTAIEGLERYPVNVRYYRDARSSIDRLGRVLVPAMDGRIEIPLAEIAVLKMARGPAMLRNENGMLSGYVYVDVSGRDVGSYVADARRAVERAVSLPPGYTLAWSGQYEAMLRVRERLKVVLPLTLLLIFVLLYWNTGSTSKTMLVLMAVPFSAVGAVWLLYFLSYNMSIGVWVGLIALMGVDAETGVFMLLYLDLAYEEAHRAGRLRNISDLRAAIVHGAAKRIRPKFMTVATMFVGLAPILWANGAGADVMKRIAAPMVGGIFTSFLLELAVYPALYEVWKWHSIKKQVG
jgi:Cu(I)/Ag(I) efflux system membrane protein CusA/SilA